MAYNKLLITKEQYIDTRHNVPVAALGDGYSKHTRSSESRTHGHINKFLQGLFKIFSNEDAYRGKDRSRQSYYIPAIHGENVGATIPGKESVESSQSTYRDIGGRATQEAKAEQRPRTMSETSRRGSGKNNQIKNNGAQSLQELENCANAARETEAGGQYEWVKSSDG